MAGSPLTYTQLSDYGMRQSLGMARNHRSRTLSYPITHCPEGWGWPGITAHVHSYDQGFDGRGRWGWPGITAHVHSAHRAHHRGPGWGWPGITAHVHLMSLRHPSQNSAGDGQESRSRTLHRKF